MRFWVARRAALEELASCSLAEVAARSGLELEAARVAAEPALALGASGMTFFDETVPGVPLARLREPSVRELATRRTGELEQLLRALSGRAWPGVRLVQSGYRRWWLGGIAYTAAETHMREALAAELSHLAPLAALAPVGVPWLEAMARDALAAGVTSGPVFGAPLMDDATLFVELEPERLARLLAWARTVARWRQPPPSSDVARAVEPDAWHAFVARHVDLLSGIREEELVLVLAS